MISSPNHPDSYPYYLMKTQTIKVEPGLVVSLQFTAFDIERCSSPISGACACDHLTITDGDGTTLMEKNCGYTLPGPITSKSNIVNFFFSTDSDNDDTMTGWSVSWSAVTPGESLAKRHNT